MTAQITVKATDARDVKVGMELAVPRVGTATVKAIGYANDLHRVGWKFEMSQGEPLIFHFHNEKAIQIIR